MTKINFSDQFFMQQAIAEAKNAFQKDEIPVGAIVVCNQQIIARAHNLTESLNDVTAHAEMLAITAASDFLGGKYLKECTLYVTLEPCTMCAGALNWSQLGRLVYGTDDDKRGYARCQPALLHPKTEVTKGILANEARELIRNFFEKKR
jgi:tRNA(adenine34) deaminase